MKNTKTKLISSVTVLLICFAMLIGSTFAWFTDSASTGVNKIQAGTLDIEAYYQDADPSGSISYDIGGTDHCISTVKFSGDKKDLEGSKLVDESVIFEPGYVGAKLITVENKGNLAAKIKLVINTQDDGLQNALWFDFIRVNENGIDGTFVKRDMSTIVAVADGVEVAVAANNGKASFIFIYGMNEDAGNQYQGKSFETSVTVLATQDKVEADSFNNEYDNDASYPTVWDGTQGAAPTIENGVMKVSNGAELAGALSSDLSAVNTIELTDDILLGGKPWNAYTLNNVNLTIDGKGHSIKGLNSFNQFETVNGGFISNGLIACVEGGNVTIKNIVIGGANIVNNEADNSASAVFVGSVNANDTTATVTFENCSVVNSSITTSAYSGGLIGYVQNAGNSNFVLTIKDCDILGSNLKGKHAGALVAFSNSEVTIDGGTIERNILSSIKHSAAALVGSAVKNVTATSVAVDGNTYNRESTASCDIYNQKYGYIHIFENANYTVDGSVVTAD